MELTDEEKLNEAEQYHLKALFILHELQANNHVYGSNSALSGATPTNIDLALQYINRSLKLYPENPVYLDLKALLLWEGKGYKESATTLFEKAAALNPRDIDIQNNLNAIKSSQCVMATTSFGTPLAHEVNVLRVWRNSTLLKYKFGRFLVASYYFFSPPVANFVSKHNKARFFCRLILRTIIKAIKYRHVDIAV